MAERREKRWRWQLEQLTLGMLSGLLVSLGVAQSRALSAEVDFERQVAPILIQRCVECHQARDPSGQLNLTTAASARTGGESGPAIEPGKPAVSHLLTRVSAGEMPPPRLGKSRKLPAAEIETLRAWIAAGAPWPAQRKLDLFERTNETRGGRDWWSFQPIARAPVPELSAGAADRRRVLTPIDSFIVADLELNELTLAPEADRRQLLRRLYADLIGLPPDAERLQEFATDTAVDAYERQVDRLLASPHFGERWGRYWLDLARFADTCGYERDQEKPHAWRYRDWVVQSFNRDLPYDEFVRQQLAGDELSNRSEESVIATGFLRLGTWNDEPNDPQEYKYERIEDLVNSVSTAFLGLTVKCARCHDHKFDPVPQTDYYRIAAAFWGGPIEPRGRELLGGPTKEELGFDVLGWTDLTATPSAFHVLKKGDPAHPGAAVEPGFLGLVPELDRPLAPPPAGAKTTHRRRQLAEWLVDPKQPLTPRVAVNRWWLHHFGQGLVRSPNNFGFQGEGPTHPELLDYLATQLQQTKWQAKPLHRLMVTSAVYRQASSHPRQEQFEQRDFGNRWWWRAERRRLDAESLRDALLAASGELDLRMGGASFKPTISAEALEGLSRKSGAWAPSPHREQLRRAVYSYAQRSLLPPLLTTFDLADSTLPCGQRDVSTVAPQALALLNNAFVHEQSESLARRALTSDTKSDAERVTTMWRWALGREPSLKERTAALDHVQSQLARFNSIEASRRAAEKRGAGDSVGGKPLPAGLVLHLNAQQGVEADADGRVTRWLDQSPAAHHATQPQAELQPTLARNAMHGRPALRFDGRAQFMHLAGQVVTSQEFTVLAVVRDNGPSGHRELFSNWNGAAGNSTTSLFVGLTNEAAVRVSDDFSGVGALVERDKPFLLTAVVSSDDVAVFQNEREIARKGSRLAPRLLTTPYVIGQQGNIQGEYWRGDLAELLVFDRALSDAEREQLVRVLSIRYNLPRAAAPPRDPTLWAWASLGHVLLNSNEFIYVD